MMPKWKSVEVHAHFFCEFWEHNARLSLTNRLRWRMTKMMGAKKRRKGIKNMSVSPRDASSSDQHVATDADARCTKRAVLAKGFCSVQVDLEFVRFRVILRTHSYFHFQHFDIFFFRVLFVTNSIILKFSGQFGRLIVSSRGAGPCGRGIV